MEAIIKKHQSNRAGGDFPHCGSLKLWAPGAETAEAYSFGFGDSRDRKS